MTTSDKNMCDPSICEKIGRMCGNCLNGVWRTVDPRELVIDRVPGCSSNIVYFCAIPPYMIQSEQDGPSKVVIRFYGSNLANEGAIDALLTDTLIVALLSERKFCPRLCGIFPGGRIEEFIPSRTLQTKELKDPEINAVIAKKMAMFHAFDIPINKEPSWIWNTITRWVNSAKARSSRPLGDEHGVDDKQGHARSSVPREWWILEAEMMWLKSYLDSLGSTVVFCHNDLYEGNILVRETAETLEEKLIIIDFEFASYNYRGYDIAQYFSQQSFDFADEEHPKFVPENLPSMDQRLHFIQCYLEASEHVKAKQSSAGDKNDREALGNEAHRLLRETDCIILANHFLWGVRAILNAPTSSLIFGYREYADARFTAYYQHKGYVLEKYGHVKKNLDE